MRHVAGLLRVPALLAARPACAAAVRACCSRTHLGAFLGGAGGAFLGGAGGAFLGGAAGASAAAATCLAMREGVMLYSVPFLLQRYA